MGLLAGALWNKQRECLSFSSNVILFFLFLLTTILVSREQITMPGEQSLFPSLNMFFTGSWTSLQVFAQYYADKSHNIGFIEMPSQIENFANQVECAVQRVGSANNISRLSSTAKGYGSPNPIKETEESPGGFGRRQKSVSSSPTF